MRSQRLVEFSKGLVSWACILLYAVMTVITFMQVIYRYFLGRPLTTSEEVARYCFVWLVLLGSAVAMWERAHIELTFLTDRFSPKANLWLRILSDIVAIIVTMVFFVIEGFRLAMLTMAQYSPATGLPMGWVYLALPVSGVLIIGAALGSIATGLQRLRLPEAELIAVLSQKKEVDWQ